MVRIYPFSAVRPEPCLAQDIAAVPYDVVNAIEAHEIIRKNPDSFLRVSRSDAELPGIPSHDPQVYERARDTFTAMLSEGKMVKDRSPSFYLYHVTRDGETYLGLACCLDVDDYRKNHIRRHEQTRYDKEEDRTRHIETTKTHNGPVVLLYRDNCDLFSYIGSLLRPDSVPEADVRTGDGAFHRIYRIVNPAIIRELNDRFSAIPNLYIADGHHRGKSAVNVADRRNTAGSSDEVNRFLGVIFAHNRVRIHGYSRLLTDLGRYTKESFLDGLKHCFTLAEYGPVDDSGYQIIPRLQNPECFHIFHLYLDGRWYECSQQSTPGASLYDSLDVTILQKHVLEDMLGITDPRGDARLQYLGGARPIHDLMQLVDNGEFVLAIAMQPVRIETVLDIADAGGIMPPKSTWFEPKLLSGLLVHSFD